jgi:hypothetical protein
LLWETEKAPFLRLPTDCRLDDANWLTQEDSRRSFDLLVSAQQADNEDGDDDAPGSCQHENLMSILSAHLGAINHNL